jgi:hypothetical protein
MAMAAIWIGVSITAAAPLPLFAVPISVDEQTYFLVVDERNVSWSNLKLAQSFCAVNPLIGAGQGCVERLATGIERYRSGVVEEAALLAQVGAFDWSGTTSPAAISARLLQSAAAADACAASEQCAATAAAPLVEVTVKLKLRPRDLERYVRTSTERAVPAAILAAAIVAEHRLPAYALAPLTLQLAATPPPLVADAPAARRGLSAIPRIFHQIWLGKGVLPLKFRAYRDTWRRLHPAWEHKLWTDDNLPPLVNHALFDSVSGYREKADILRYELLYRYGGVYVDTDFECFKSIEPLLASAAAGEGGTTQPSAFSSQESPEHISIGIMGSTQGNAFFGRIVDNLPQWHAHHAALHIGYRTGPFLVRAAYAEWPAELALLPTWALYPYHSTNLAARGRNGTYFPDAYAAHHWQFDV